VSLPSSYRSRRGHIHLLRVLPLVGCRSKTPTIMHKTERSMGTLYSATRCYLGYSQHTLIHCSVWSHDSMLRATTAGSIRLSSNSCRPPRLDDVASGMGAERIGTAFSMMGSWTTTSMLAPGSGSTHVSMLSSGATVAPSLGAVPSVATTIGSVGSVPTTVASIATTSGVVASSVCAPV
jgi:hypothetical protein